MNQEVRNLRKGDVGRRVVNLLCVPIVVSSGNTLAIAEHDFVQKHRREDHARSVVCLTIDQKMFESPF